MPTNLSLLARIARGERSFRAPPLGRPEDEQEFHQLVADARQLAVAGYVSPLRRSSESGAPAALAIDVEAPGITPAGLAALRQAGYEIPGLADRGGPRRSDD